MIDAHAHLFHPRWYPWRFSHSLVRGYLLRQRGKPRDRETEQAKLFGLLSDDTGEKTLRLMDRVGVDTRVILIIDWGVQLGEPECSLLDVHNEILGICSTFRDRLVGYAGVDPRRAGAADLLRRAFDDLGARGLKLHPTGNWELGDEKTHRIVELAAERRLPVLVHVGRTLDLLSDRHAQPAAFLELAQAFPGSAFIAGHSGFELWNDFVESSENVPSNVYFDISGWQDMVGGQPERLSAALSGLLSAFPRRVCFGSDAPFFSYNLPFAEKKWLDLVQQCTRELSGSMGEAASNLLANAVVTAQTGS